MPFSSSSGNQNPGPRSYQQRSKGGESASKSSWALPPNPAPWVPWAHSLSLWAGATVLINKARVTCRGCQAAMARRLKAFGGFKLSSLFLPHVIVQGGFSGWRHSSAPHGHAGPWLVAILQSLMPDFLGSPGIAFPGSQKGERVWNGMMGGVYGPDLEGAIITSVHVPLLGLSSMSTSKSKGGGVILAASPGRREGAFLWTVAASTTSSPRVRPQTLGSQMITGHLPTMCQTLYKAPEAQRWVGHSLCPCRVLT